MEWLTGLGLTGLFLGTFLAATIAAFSSDVLYAAILMTGVSPWAVFVVGTLGNWLGGITTFGIGYLGKWEWIERWFKVKRETLEKQQIKVNRWGPPLAIISWVPIVGDLYVLALGFYKVNLPKTAFWMFIGKGGRFLVWTLLFLKWGEAILR